MLNPKIGVPIKELLFHTPLRKVFFPRYIYMFSPPQLCFLCQCVEETRHVKGAMAEVGCESGLTTIFINKYMDAKNIEKNYYAIDTFSGFRAEDVDFEVSRRGKTKKLFQEFEINKKKWFDGTMRQNNISRVHSIEADVNRFDLKSLGQLSFVLLDVDLYRPIKKAMGELWEVLSPGGIIVVDDCNASCKKWDGAHQAYTEFMEDIGEDAEIVYDKLGVLRKPVNTVRTGTKAGSEESKRKEAVTGTEEVSVAS